MKTLIITITLLTTLCIGSDTMSSNAFGLDLTTEITIADLWNNLDRENPIPDTVGQYAETNIIYRKNNLTCYLLIDKLYSIEIEKGKYEHLKIGMSLRRIFRILGETEKQTFPNNKILLEYSYGENINYIMTLEVKNKKLTKIIINKKI